jgi:hypothetical protein
LALPHNPQHFSALDLSLAFTGRSVLGCFTRGEVIKKLREGFEARVYCYRVPGEDSGDDQ